MDHPVFPPATDLSAPLLAWYDQNRRVLPWRVPAGEAADSYRVWISEIMLQQTVVEAVKPYYQAFLDRWPTVTALAGADLDDVLHAWAGLGYYSRARNLHAAAVRVANEMGGHFPTTEAGLRGLPGIGAYTAAAIAAIAFGERAAAVDGNVIRVTTRLLGLAAPLPGVKKTVEEAVRPWVPADRPGDFAQALMDLGATVCRPRNPDCALCPWEQACRARREGRPERYPVRAAKKEKPTRRGVAFWLVRDDGAVMLRRRAERGLLGGMMEVPSSDWGDVFPDETSLDRHIPLAATGLQVLPGLVRHTFTHFHLELKVATGRVAGGAGHNQGVWCPPDGFSTHALPTVMKKVVAHALDREGA